MSCTSSQQAEPWAGERLPGAPQIAGSRFRPFNDDGDYERLTEIITRSRDEDGVPHLQSVAGLRHNYRDRTGFEPRRDVVVAEVQGQPVGFARVMNAAQQDGTRIFDVTGQVLPQWRGRGIGTALLGWGESCQRGIAGESPDSDTGMLLESTIFDGQVGARRLLESNGYALTPELELQDMVRPTLDDVPSAPLPAGLELRRARPEHMRQIWALFRNATIDGPGSLRGDEADYQRWATLDFWDRGLWQIAWDGGQPVGMVLNFIRRDENEHFGRLRGYTEYINVARSWRRRGVARALIVQSLGVLKQCGMREAALDVYVDNPTGALHLYESLGYRAVGSFHCYRKPLST